MLRLSPMGIMWKILLFDDTLLRIAFLKAPAQCLYLQNA